MGTLEQERQQRIQVAGDTFPPSPLTSPFTPLLPLFSLLSLSHPSPFSPPPPLPYSPSPSLHPSLSLPSILPPSPPFSLSSFLPLLVSLSIKTHYNFLEHRERLCHEVDTIAATNCVFEPPKELQLPRKMKKLRSGGTAMGISLPGKLFCQQFCEKGFTKCFSLSWNLFTADKLYIGYFLHHYLHYI